MNKIFVVTGTRYSTDVEIWHTRTDLFHNIIGIYSTKKLDAAIFLLKSAREQLKLPYYKFNTTRYVDEIREARRLQADVLRESKTLFERLK